MWGHRYVHAQRWLPVAADGAAGSVCWCLLRRQEVLNSYTILTHTHVRTHARKHTWPVAARATLGNMSLWATEAQPLKSVSMIGWVCVLGGQTGRRADGHAQHDRLAGLGWGAWSGCKGGHVDFFLVVL
jgi:hypothetical protein